MSENTNNEIVAEDINDSTPVTETEKVEEVKVEETKIEEAKAVEPKIEEAPALEEDVIVVPEPAKQQGLGAVADGVMGVASFTKEVKKPVAKKVDAKKQDTVAIHSTKNVTWPGVGKVYIGYNIVAKDAADKWLSRGHVRLATPEEVAKEFGK